MIREFVLRALRPACLLSDEPPAGPFPGDSCAWNQALDLSERLHAAAPFAAVALRLGEAELPMPARGLFENRLRLERLRLAVLDQEMESAIACLEARSIPVMLVKGMDLGRRYYPSRLLRPMADADLLVPPQSYWAALDALGQAGFERIGPLLPGRFRAELRRPASGGSVIELHCRLQRGETPERTRLIWGTSLEGAIPGLPASIRALHPWVLVPYLIRHAAVQHLLESPIWLNDIHLVLEKSFRDEASWHAAVQGLQEQRTCSAGWFVLSYLRENWETPIPQDVTRELARRAGLIRPALLSGKLRPKTWFTGESGSLPTVLWSRLLLRDSAWEALSYAIHREQPHSAES